MRIFLDELLPFRLNQTLDFQRLRDHRGHDPKKLDIAIEVAVRLELQIDANGAGGLAVQDDRHAQVTQLLLRQFWALGGTIEKHRFATHARHHDRSAALDHAAGDAFTNLVARFRSLLDEAVGGFHLQRASFFMEQDDRAPYGAMVAAEDLEHPMQASLEIERTRESLTGFEQGRELADLAGGRVGGAWGACGRGCHGKMTRGTGSWQLVYKDV